MGEILAAVQRLGLDERTLILFTSDNGPWTSYGDHAGSAGPFREGKLTTFEGGHRTPLIARWPHRVPAGRSSDALFAAMDLHATLLALIGAAPPREGYDGENLLPVLLGERGAKGRDEFWYYSTGELQAVRQGRWKLHLPHEYLALAGPPGHDGKPANFGQIRPGVTGAITNSGLSGIASRHGYRFDKIGLALFDLTDDPGEKRDVSAQHPEIVARLQARAAVARADLGDTLTGVPARGARPVGEFPEPAKAN
jgi:arylsulfatase